MTLGPRDRVIGQVYIEGDLRVAGTIEGEVEVTGDVEIDDMATVKASLAGRDVSIRGRVTGAVMARKRLIVARSGSLTGDVRVARLIIQDGASFSGKVSMGAAAVAAAPAKAVEAKPAVSEPEAQAVVEPPAPTPSTPVPAMPELPAPHKPAAPALSAPKVPPPAAQVRADGKGGKAKAPPPKAKPKRR